MIKKRFIMILSSSFKDTLKAFNDFKNKQPKSMK